MFDQARVSHESFAVLRIGFGLMFLPFGIYQLIDPAAWYQWLPHWLLPILSQYGIDPSLVIYANGILELVLGICILIGFLARWCAGLLGLHLASITFMIGWNPIGWRDFGLVIGLAALSMHSTTIWSIDSWLAKRKAAQNNVSVNP